MWAFLSRKQWGAIGWAYFGGVARGVFSPPGPIGLKPLCDLTLGDPRLSRAFSEIHREEFPPKLGNFLFHTRRGFFENGLLSAQIFCGELQGTTPF